MAAELAGSIERIVYANPATRYTVARLRPVRPAKPTHDLITVVGTLPAVRPGEQVELTGEWEAHPRHGVNFRVARCAVRPPNDPAAIAQLLASGLVRGVGPARAHAIVELFGDDTVRIIEEEPARLAEVPGIGPVHAQAIGDAWREQGAVRELMAFLTDLEIDAALAPRIHRALGDDAIAAIHADPYVVEREVDGIGFATADRLAARLGTDRNALSRVASGVRWVLGQASDEGHTFLPRHELVSRTATLLSVDPARVRSAIDRQSQAKALICDPGWHGDDRIFLTPLFLAESGLARRLRAIRAAGESIAAASVPDRSTDGFLLAPRQRKAIELALQEPVAILTGGPGTGKTSTLRTLLDVLDAARVSVALAAPTGRAARRLSEVTGRPALTLHRMLDFDPIARTFGRDDSNPLAASFVVVDEASMLDVLMAYRLAKAIRPGAHLLLVGDADQLPSIGPGNVVRDLIGGGLPSIELVDLFRQAQGSEIVVNAHRVRRGLAPVIRNHPESDLFLLHAEDAEATLDLISDVVADRLPAKRGLDPIADIQVLSPMYGGPAGVDALNARLQSRLNPAHPSRPELFAYGRVFRKGDKVMQTRNDYDRGVANGDIGFIRHVDPAAGRVVVAYAEENGWKLVNYPSWDLDELAHAYATTVHKAQGGEFPVVVIPMVAQHYPVLERNLLYSAMTRAKQLCIFVGRGGTITVAAHRNKADRRYTALRDRLRETPASRPALSVVARRD